MLVRMMERSAYARVLMQHLRTEALLGVESVPIGGGSRVGDRDRVEELGTAMPDVEMSASDSGTVASGVSDESGAVSPAMDRDTKIETLRSLDEDEVRGCTDCELCNQRTQTVFGEGDPDAGLMFIGEGPGENEDRQGRPFVGRAGDLLNKQIAAMGLTRDEVYIANVVKCRPPQNRAPAPSEVDACWGYLRRQIWVIRPRVIVTLGGPATKLLLDTKKGITSIRGVWASYDGLQPEGPKIPIMPTFHPAYLLRAYTPDNRRKVWSDLQQAMSVLAESRG